MDILTPRSVDELVLGVTYRFVFPSVPCAMSSVSFESAPPFPAMSETDDNAAAHAGSLLPQLLP